MAFVSGRRSTLNPDAPLFVPAAFRQVEDFSPEWWQLVTDSTWYHDYWLSQQQEEDGFYDNVDDDIDNLAELLPDTFDADVDEDFLSMEAHYEEFIRSGTEELKPTLSNTNVVHKYGAMNSEAMKKNIHMMTAFQSGVPKVLTEPAKYAEKAASASKRASPRYSPRSIQQPR